MKHIKILLPIAFALVSVLNANADENEIILSECDFETKASYAEWSTYDLDGKALVVFHPGEPRGWFWKYESNEVEEGNSVFAASSFFGSNTPDNITPADDWLFSNPLAIGETGSYSAQWDARSMLEWLDDYEVRIIEAGVWTELESGFTKETLLSEASGILVEHSDLLLTVLGEPEEWQRHQLSLDAYRGKTVRMVWRYISADRHTIYIDNFKYIKRTDTGIGRVHPAALEMPVTVYNLQGQQVFTSTARSESECLDIALPSGIYLVKWGDKTWKLIR